MINRLIILSSLLLVLSSTLQGSMKPTTRSFYNQNPDKQALIRKILLYCSFNKLLNIDNSHDDLFLITQLMKKGRAHILLLLQPCFSDKNLVHSNLAHRLIKALYCLSLSEEEISKTKKFGRQLLLIAHPDKSVTTDNTAQTIEEIKELLINNQCGDSLHKLFEDRKKDIFKDQERIYNDIMTSNYYRMMANRFLDGAAYQIGHDISSRVINRVIPEPKRTEYIVDQNFVTKSQLNQLLIASELNKYPSQLHLRD